VHNIANWVPLELTNHVFSDNCTDIVAHSITQRLAYKVANNVISDHVANTVAFRAPGCS
jgi:hypothetical protein